MGVDIRDRGTDVSTGRGAAGRPVLLATLGVPLNEEASVFAVDTAVESGQRLVVANVTARSNRSACRSRSATTPSPELTPEVSASLRRSAELARSLGVRVERLRVRSPRPRAGAVGPGRRRASRGCSYSARTGRRFASGATGRRSEAVRERVTCSRLGSQRRRRATVTFLIDCPNCGPREALEFSYGGERTRRAGSGCVGSRPGRLPVLPRERQRLADRVVAPSRRVPEDGSSAERHTETNEVRRTFWPGEGLNEQRGRPATASPSTRPRRRDRTAPTASRRGHPARPTGHRSPWTGGRSARSRATRSVRRWPRRASRSRALVQVPPGARPVLHDGGVSELPDAGRRDPERPLVHRAGPRRDARRTPERVAERGPRHPRLAEHVLVHDAAGLLLQDLPPASVGVEDGRAVHPLEGRSRQGAEGRGPRAARGATTSTRTSS